MNEDICKQPKVKKINLYRLAKVKQFLSIFNNIGNIWEKLLIQNNIIRKLEETINLNIAQILIFHLNFKLLKLILNHTN